MAKQTKNLSRKIIKEALGIAGGLYRMNASTSKGYAFSEGIDGTICYGIFVDYDEELGNNDGFISFKNCELHGKKFNSQTINDIASGQSISIQDFMEAF
jgi:hypothetical protein